MKAIKDRKIITPGDLDGADESEPRLDEQVLGVGLREAMDKSRSGAPAVGEAVSDIFSTDEIFHRLMATADEEFSRPSRLLFLSGLAAGLSIGLTFLARAAPAMSASGTGSGFPGVRGSGIRRGHDEARVE